MVLSQQGRRSGGFGQDDCCLGEGGVAAGGHAVTLRCVAEASAPVVDGHLVPINRKIAGITRFVVHFTLFLHYYIEINHCIHAAISTMFSLVADPLCAELVTRLRNARKAESLGRGWRLH
jgi:hypothetical protein